MNNAYNVHYITILDRSRSPGMGTFEGCSSHMETK